MRGQRLLAPPRLRAACGRSSGCSGRHLDDIPPATLPEGFDSPAGRPEPCFGTSSTRAARRSGTTGVPSVDDEAAFERFACDDRTDPSLFVVGFAGDEIAGAVLNVIDDAENGLFDRRRGCAGLRVRAAARTASAVLAGRSSCAAWSCSASGA